MDVLIGRVLIGRYRVTDFLGKGVMAQVYKVLDQNRSVYLAMKRWFADHAEDMIFPRRSGVRHMHGNFLAPELCDHLLPSFLG